MKKVVLLKLLLRDFQGGNLTLDTNGKNVDIFATNGAGKTRIASAVSWLLFDKDSMGRSDFEIKNTDAFGEKAHNLEHTVEGIFLIETDPTGVEVTLKKVYKEIWTKKRGSPTSTFTGHTQDYFIDGVPVQKKEYVQRIMEIAGSEETFRLLTSPTVFPAMHWQKQRSLLLDVCGDMTDADVIATDSKLASLPSILGKHKLDDYKKIVAARRSEINKAIEMIPVRIDEQRRSMPDLADISAVSVIESEIMRLESEIADRKLKISGIDNGSDIATLSKQLAGIRSDMQAMESDHYAKTMQKVNELNQRIIELTQKMTLAHSQVDAVTQKCNALINSIGDAEILTQKLRDEWMRVDAESHDDDIEGACSACGQPLPADKVQAARDKSLADFNNYKANKLAEIKARGMEMSALIKANKSKIESLATERGEYELDFMATAPLVKLLTEEKDETKSQATSYNLIDGYRTKSLDAENIQKQIDGSRAGVQDNIGVHKVAISAFEATLDGCKKDMAKITQRQQCETRIDTLKDEEKKLSVEFEKLESELFMMEQFIRTKVRLLTDRINGRFQVARFKLFDEQVNGGLQECCEITVNGIPYNSGLNNAARVNAGLDVCRTLSQHYGLLAPIFVDNAESVVKLIDMDAQVIRLVVSEIDEKLRVVVI